MAYLKKVAVVNSTTFVCRQVKMCHISVLKIKLFILAIFFKVWGKKAIKPMPCASLKIISHISENKQIQLLPMVTILKATLLHEFACVFSVVLNSDWSLLKSFNMFLFLILFCLWKWVPSIKWPIFYLHFLEIIIESRHGKQSIDHCCQNFYF